MRIVGNTLPTVPPPVQIRLRPPKKINPSTLQLKFEGLLNLPAGRQGLILSFVEWIKELQGESITCSPFSLSLKHQRPSQKYRKSLFSLWSPTNFHATFFEVILSFLLNYPPSIAFLSRVHSSQATELTIHEYLPCSALTNGQGCRIDSFLNSSNLHF